MTERTRWRDDVVALIPALRAFAWSLAHNGSDADDLVQETLIKAWAHRDKFETGTNLRAWLFTILRNTYYTAAVRRRRETADPDGIFAASLSVGPTQDWSVALGSLRKALDLRARARCRCPGPQTPPAPRCGERRCRRA